MHKLLDKIILRVRLLFGMNDKELTEQFKERVIPQFEIIIDLLEHVVKTCKEVETNLKSRGWSHGSNMEPDSEMYEIRIRMYKTMINMYRQFGIFDQKSFFQRCFEEGVFYMDHNINPRSFISLRQFLETELWLYNEFRKRYLELVNEFKLIS